MGVYQGHDAAPRGGRRRRLRTVTAHLGCGRGGGEREDEAERGGGELHHLSPRVEIKLNGNPARALSPSRRARQALCDPWPEPSLNHLILKTKPALIMPRW